MAEIRVALVTGANRGIGLETARQLARVGLMVCLGCRDAEAGERARDDLGREGLDAPVIPLDVTYGSSVGSALQIVETMFGRLDVLVNNAGVLIDRDPEGRFLGVEGVGTDVLKATLEVNTVGAMRMTQAALPLMRRGRYGRIVNVSSRLGQLDTMGTGAAAYRMSKAALNALTRTTAVELAAEPIKVNAMAPGWVRTDMGGPNASKSVEEGADTVVWLATLPEDGPSGLFFEDRVVIPW
ncbi:MAG: SDR family oxidoreductase [Pseudomonadota bacterium]